MNRIALTLAMLAATVAVPAAAFAQHMGPVYEGPRTGGAAVHTMDHGPAMHHTMHHGPAMHRTAIRSARIGVAGPRIGHRAAWARPHLRSYARPYRGYGVGLAGATVAGAVVGGAAEAAYYGTGGYGYRYGGYGGYPAGHYGDGANYYPAYTSGYYGYRPAYGWGSGCGYRAAYSYCRPCGGCGSAWGW